MKIIDSFEGEYDFLSNFYMKMVYYEGLYYASSEHAFQAAKTRIPGEMDLVRNCKTPGQAKRKASKKAGKITIRPDWDIIKNHVMLKIVRSKFQDKELADKLVATSPLFLIEGNTWHDNYWGNCICDKCNNILGLNMLGYILMTIRSETMLERKQ